MTEPNLSGTKVFIAGAPRSGTSILVFALKEVFGLPGFGESHVMPAFQRMVHQLRAYTNGFTSISDPVMLKKLNRSALERHLFEYIRQFYRDNFPEGSWIDKTPSGEAVFGLPLIESVFPDARLIATKRNGIEVVTSHVKKFNSSFDDACLNWVNAMKGLVHARQGCHHLLEVDQYDFLNAPEEVSQRIAIHLNAGDRAEELANYFANHRVEQSSVLGPKKRARLADTNWSDDERKLFKHRCGSMMKAFGYEI
jgi:hypothetical protein